MCELLGMSFNQPVRPRISFKGFRLRGKDNPQGWGLAFYPDKSVQVFKEPLEASESSQLSKFIVNYSNVRSKLFIAHVRLASELTRSHKNTHPFYRELNRKEYIFAHNGTLNGYRAFELGRFRPVGETDSEYAFCYLLKLIEERGIEYWEEEDCEWLAEILKEINSYGTFNCLFSDGEFLFCYHDKTGYKGLCFVHRKPPYGTIQLLDEHWRINLAEEKDPSQTGYIIATKKLTDEQWKDFQPGELIVFRKGKIIYSNLRTTSEEEPNQFTFLELNILRIIRSHPHRVSLREIIEESEKPTNNVKQAIKSLLSKEYIKQDSRDIVEWNNENATFYTMKSKRDEIDRLIK